MQVTMLLDNHYGPDRRVQFEAELLTSAGAGVRVVSWDRRPDGADEELDVDPVHLVRRSVPAPAGGGLKSLLAMARFSARVWRQRRRLLAGTDVVYVHDLYLLPIGVLLARGRVLVYDAHEDFRRMDAERRAAWVLAAVEHVETWLARKASLVVVPGRTRLPRWAGVGIDAVVLPNVGGTAESRRAAAETRWDLVCLGNLEEAKHPELLVDVARARPDLSIAAGGGGRSAPMLEAAANELPNLEWLGWVEDPDAVLAQGAAVYYGFDPGHPYASVACPNTLYQALRVRRPLVFFSDGGELGEVTGRFRVGVRAEPTAAALSEAIERAQASDAGWEFDEAWSWLAPDASAQAYVAAVLDAS